MRCTSCEINLDRYIETTLPPRRLRATNAHLASCPACRDLAAELHVVDALLATARSPALPPNFTFAVMAEARALPLPPTRRTPAWSIVTVYLIATWAALALAAWRFGLLRAIHALNDPLRAAFTHATHGIEGTTLAMSPIIPAVLIGVLVVLTLDVALVGALIAFHRFVRPHVAARLTFVAAVIFGCTLALAAGGSAEADTTSVYHGGTYFGSVVVEPGQVVDGDLNVVFGNATIDGTVNGNVNVVDGGAYIAPGGAVTGQINAVGGDVTRAIVPWAPDAALSVGNDSRIYWKVGLDAIVLLAFLVFPARTRVALGRLENHAGLSLAAGVIGWIAVIPLAIALCCTLVLIPLVLLEAIALLVGCLVGTAALALLIGRRLSELLSAQSTPVPLMALVLGLVVITAAEMVPVIGWLVSALVVLVGLGCVLLTFFGEYAYVGSSTPPETRPPMSGPPMTVG